MSASHDVFYVLDAQDRIADVSGSWDEVARENPPLDTEVHPPFMANVMGRALQEFIHDKPTQVITSFGIHQVRALHRAKTLDYRCDTPTEKRFMRMELIPEDADRVRLTHHLLRTEPIDPPLTFMETSEFQRGTMHRCSLCNRLEIKGRWVEPDSGEAQALTQPIRVNHTLCADCYQRTDDWL